MDRAERAGGVQLVVGDVDRDDVGARRRGDLHRREPRAAPGAVDRDPLAAADPRLVDDPVEGRHVAAGERGDVGEADALGHLDQVDVGEADHDVLGEGAPVRDPGHQGVHVLADVLVAAAAELARALAGVHREDDAGPLLPTPDVAADLHHGAGELVAEHERGLDPRSAGPELPGPQGPVGPADAVRPDPHDRAVRRADGVGHVLEDERAVEFLDDCGAHGAASSCCGVKTRGAGSRHAKSTGSSGGPGS